MPPPRARPATSGRCVRILVGWNLQNFEPGTPKPYGHMGFQRRIQLLFSSSWISGLYLFWGEVNLIHQLLTSSIFQFLGLFAHTFDLFPHMDQESRTPPSSRNAGTLVNDPSISKRSYKIHTTNRKVVNCLFAMPQSAQKKRFNNCWCFRNQELTTLSIVARIPSTPFIPTGFIKTNLRWWSWCSRQIIFEASRVGPLQCHSIDGFRNPACHQLR